MIKKIIQLFIYLITFSNIAIAQVVTIDNYSVNSIGQVQLSIQAQASKYYVLKAQHSPTFEWETSMTMGVNGTMVISEPAAAYPLSDYTITEHDIASPDDLDGDGIDDITEFNNMPTDAPINFADPIAFIDGATSIPDAQTFTGLATINNVSWAPFLDGQLYVKFGILDRDSNDPKIYFINSHTYSIHASFWNGIGATVNGDDGSGEIVFNPSDILPNGVIGSYSFNFSFGDAKSFEATQRTYELLVANMPFLQNNMNHFIGESDENDHLTNYASDFVGSRIDVVLESDVFAEINYIPFHEAEGYGFFKHMALDEDPGSRDIVLYDALPNSLPRVGGIITSVVQTPLSHVNLRAIQDDVPNAYIKDPLSIDSISDLLGGYIYYKVENEEYIIREATLDEVNTWYENLRPTEPQVPIRDLSFTKILPLDSIEFGMATAFGAKCSNVATMRSFGLPVGTIPDGFGIPFYFYDEFMKYNNFYLEAEVMINNPTFSTDLNFRIERLKDFRKDIKDAPMPQWMMNELQTMHDAFPVGTKVRCRSSTNNEDLPGFSGAGLYTSKTQHLDEGHISKSIKQVYASMWNFRAYEERDFYRIDQFVAAMGILCHSNFEDEHSNGVGISIDPIYETDSTFYLNTQVGESLITNPDPNSVPEEILLYENPTQGGGGYLVLRLSNLVNINDLIMDQVYLDQMREYLSTIHNEFEILYDVVGAEGFAMDIEYKVTAQDQLIIKQARPWVSFWANVKANDDLSVTEIVNPQSSSSLGNSELVTTKIANTGLNEMSDFDISLIVDGILVETINISDTIKPFEDADFQFTVPQDFSTVGDYNITGVVTDVDDNYINNDTLNVVLSKVHLLDGSISIGPVSAVCDEIQVSALIMNQGETTINNVEIQVVVNGMVVETVNVGVDVPFQEQGLVTISIDNNLQQLNNSITLNLLSVNSQIDDDISNNSASTTADLNPDYDIITLTINADNWSQEISWELIDLSNNKMIASEELGSGINVYNKEICVDYGSCFSFTVYDSYGDGIFSPGNVIVENALGGNIFTIDGGDYDHEAQEVFCFDGAECDLIADVDISNSSSEIADDGSITINTNTGLSPFQYSIDNGQTFSGHNSFFNLVPGSYTVLVQDAMDFCSYEETVTIETCIFHSADIEATLVSSVVTANGSIVINPTSGVAPYQYSIDGGQNFVANNVFPDLAVGNYNVIVQDASGICLYEERVPVKVCQVNGNISSTDATSEFATDGTIIINPTSGSAPFQYSIDGGQNFVSNNIFFNLGAGTYEILFRDAGNDCNYRETITIEACLINADITTTNATSEFATDGTIIINPTSGSAPYQYSIDGGQNFVTNNEFISLTAGDYEIVFEDAASDCRFEKTVKIEADIASSIDDVLLNGIKIYPNPTSDNFRITIEGSSMLVDEVNFEIYDNLGRKIQTGVISKSGNNFETTISLSSYSSGAYFIKCHNNAFKKYFKIVKM